MKTINDSVSSVSEGSNDSNSFESELPPFGVKWIEEQEITAEDTIAKATSGDEDSLIGSLKECVAGELTSFSNEREERVRALIYAWTGGKMLLTYKAKKEHGTFGAWLADAANAACTSVRTLQRHMKVAREFDSISSLVSKASSRRAAYLLSKNTDRGPDEASASQSDEKGKSPQSDARGKEISAAFTKFQNKLRLLSKGAPLSDVQKDEIIEAWKQIDALYHKLINPA
jgi:hypothetical protein